MYQSIISAVYSQDFPIITSLKAIFLPRVAGVAAFRMFGLLK
jgi:hypothetical protein